MFCTKCGNELEDNVRFCDKCGNPVSTEGVSEVAAEPNAINNVKSADGAKVFLDMLMKNKKLMGVVLGAVVVVLMLVIGIGVLSGGKDGEGGSLLSVSESEESKTLKTALKFSGVGDVVTYGAWEGTPCEWIVLNNDGSRALLLSKTPLENRAWDSKGDPVSWEDSEIRAYLNEEMINKLFTEGEKQALCEAEIHNPSGEDFYAEFTNTQYYDSDQPLSTADTKDRLFLLSWKEAIEYCGPVSNWEQNGVVHAQLGSIVALGDFCPINKWWLRSPDAINMALSVDNMFGNDVCTTQIQCQIGVRPAFYVEY